VKTYFFRTAWGKVIHYVSDRSGINRTYRTVVHKVLNSQFLNLYIAVLRQFTVTNINFTSVASNNLC
jgi:hypothetical protein